jgi:hypothetical protein
MKPWTDSFIVVTATANLAAAAPVIKTWQDRASFCWPLVVVLNGSEDEGRIDGEEVIMVRSRTFLGSVPAFRAGVDAAGTRPLVRMIACLHDDLEILEPGWDTLTINRFASHRVGLVGFSGATGLGSTDIYQREYQPMQLARQGFMSNLVNAEAHGQRSTVAQQVVCCDGFSLVGRASWWLRGQPGPDLPKAIKAVPRPWTYFTQEGVRHHAYDSWMGVLAFRAGWETWYQPIRCDHKGGRTAVGNPGYSEWAAAQGGDGEFWAQAHKVLYRDGRGVLPLRVGR